MDDRLDVAVTLMETEVGAGDGTMTLAVCGVDADGFSSAATSFSGPTAASGCDR